MSFQFLPQIPAQTNRVLSRIVCPKFVRTLPQVSVQIVCLLARIVWPKYLVPLPPNSPNCKVKLLSNPWPKVLPKVLPKPLPEVFLSPQNDHYSCTVCLDDCTRHIIFICFIAPRISEQTIQMTTCGKHVTIMSEGDWTQVRPMSLPTMKAK